MPKVTQQDAVGGVEKMQDMADKTGQADVHIYMDDATGNMYIFNGSELVKIGNKTPQIGDKGDEVFQSKEEKERQAQIEKEKEEFGDEDEETEEEKQQRLDDIKKARGDDITRQEIENETSGKVNRDMQRKKAAQGLEQVSSPIQRFRASLDKFIANQVRREKNKTWKRSDMRYEGSGVMRRGKQYTRNTKIPKINVYFDRSGSWGDADTKVGMEAIGILNNYVNRGEITIDIYYFANHVGTTTSSGEIGRGTGAGAEIAEHIISTKPDNVIIMTDDDMDYGRWEEILEAPKVKVPGAAWFLFRRAASKALPEWIQGRKQTRQFII